MSSPLPAQSTSTIDECAADGAADDPDALALAFEPSPDTREGRIAIVMRQIAALESADAQVRDRVSSRTRARAVRAPGPSAVFSLRLSPDELSALELRADQVGVPPSVLARNLIRIGLPKVQPLIDSW